MMIMLHIFICHGNNLRFSGMLLLYIKIYSVRIDPFTIRINIPMYMYDVWPESATLVYKVDLKPGLILLGGKFIGIINFLLILYILCRHVYMTYFHFITHVAHLLCLVEFISSISALWSSTLENRHFTTKNLESSDAYWS